MANKNIAFFLSSSSTINPYTSVTISACAWAELINVISPLMDEQGRLRAEFTIEGMHIKPEGYRAIFEDVMKYVME